MGEICLSVAPILRCQSLTRSEAGVLLIPPGLEIIFAIVLLWVKRGSDKKHVFLALEVFVYFILAVLDLLTHTIPTIGTSLDSFRSLDIIIGVASFIPIFLYTFALYLLTSTEIVPSLPIRFQKVAKYSLLAFIPIIIVLNEFASFIGITYRSFGGIDGVPLVLGVGFTNTTAQTFLSSVTLVLLTAFQAANFCIAFYRLIRALSHQRTIDATQKDVEAHLFRGLGWIVAGLKLGAIETLIGFAPGGFGATLTRRLLRLLSHACLIIGIVKGVDTTEDFRLYSPGESQRRRKSMLRAMIANPRLSTFRHVGGHDFEKQNPFDEKRNSVIKLGDPSWMRRDYVKPQRTDSAIFSARKSALTFKLASRPSIGGKSVRDSTSSFGSSKRNSWPYARTDFGDVQADAEEIQEVPYGLPIPRPPRAPVDPRQRVTVHIRQDRLPVLELRRFSNLEFLDLIHDPFRDPQRAYSLPGQLSPAQQHPVGHVSASFTRLPKYGNNPSPVPPVPVARAPSVRSTVTRGSHAGSFVNYDRPWSNGPIYMSPTPLSDRDSAISFGNKRASVTSIGHRASVMTYDEQPPSATSFHALGSPSTITSWVSPGSDVNHATPMSRRARGLSSSTTVSEVQAIALQFPGPPPRPFANAPSHRSMLSQEVARDEFIAGPIDPVEESSPEPSPVAEPRPKLVRIPSVRRKPAPLMTEGLVEEHIKDVQIEQVVDEEDALHSLPTPLSAPRFQNAPRLHPHSASRRADVPFTPSDGSDMDEGGVYQSEELAMHSASYASRNERDGQLVRLKSVGSSVSSAHRTAIPRDSIKVELGHIARQGGAEVEMDESVRSSIYSDY